MKRLLVLAGVLVASLMVGVVAASAADEGFFAFPGGGNWVSIRIGTDFTDIQRFPSLPKGMYVANASAVLASDSPAFNYVDCIFKIGGNIQGDLARGIIGGTISSFITLPLTTGFRIDEDQDLAVACRSEGSGVVWSQPSPITAIRVNKLAVKKGLGFQP